MGVANTWIAMQTSLSRFGFVSEEAEETCEPTTPGCSQSLQ